MTHQAELMQNALPVLAEEGMVENEAAKERRCGLCIHPAREMIVLSA